MTNEQVLGKGAASSAAAAIAGGGVRANQSARILPPPRKHGGEPLMSAFAKRRSTRAFSPRPLSDLQLSDLLWAANGVNRPSGDRTAPYWRHIMVIDVFVAMSTGVWCYDPEAHALVLHQQDDLRALSGTQDFVGVAPVELIYVAHGERVTDVKEDERRLYAGADASFIGQNVYLFCASEGLASVFRGSANQDRLGAAMRLPSGQFVCFAQTVGYAAD